MAYSEKNPLIERYFDELSSVRDLSLLDPVLNYEQQARQKGVMFLLMPKRGEKILDVGCGNARDMKELANKGSFVVGIDFSRGMLCEGQVALRESHARNATLACGDATFLPFKDETFDKVSCSEVIEHIPDWERAVKECRRVLKRGGVFVVTTPNRHSLYGLSRKIVDLIRLMTGLRRRHPLDEWKTEDEVVGVLRSNHFEIVQKVGICFLPGQFTYVLPRRVKRYVVGITKTVEQRFLHRFSKCGYNIAVSAIRR